MRFIVEGSSMEPFIRSGDQIIASRFLVLFSKLKKNDIVIIRHPLYARTLIIKRIQYVLSKKRYIVQGDHCEESTDSNAFGSVLKKDIVAKVIL